MHVCGMKSGLPTWCKDTLARRHPRLARMAAGPGIIEPPTLERAVAAVTVCVPCELKRVHPVSSRTYATCSHALARQRARLLLQAGCETRHGATPVGNMQVDAPGRQRRSGTASTASGPWRRTRRSPHNFDTDRGNPFRDSCLRSSSPTSCRLHFHLSFPLSPPCRAPANVFFCFTAWLLRVE